MPARLEGAAGARGGRVVLGSCIAPCLSFPSNATERMLLSCAGCTVRHARSWWDHVPGVDPWHLWAQPQRIPSQLFPGVLGRHGGCWDSLGPPWVMGNGVACISQVTPAASSKLFWGPASSSSSPTSFSKYAYTRCPSWTSCWGPAVSTGCQGSLPSPSYTSAFPGFTPSPQCPGAGPPTW